MSRGWESKDVESQQQAHEERKRLSQEKPPSAQEAALQGKRESLLLDRTRILHDLENARHPRYQDMLRAALAHLDAKLAGLEHPVVQRSGKP